MEEKLAVTETELNELLASTPFTRQLGLRLVSVADGECRLWAPFRPEYERPGGIVSGQVFMTAADVALWLAIKTRLGLHDGSVTADMSTVFLGAARREDIWCTATVLKWGNRLIVGTAECSNENGQRLTHHTISYARGGP
jgi:uncharacterized protein (TIGR00369 family)